ncbi:hypothetical protein Rhopal_002474-T1 [Rhodotorula paludigena]|uniref:18S rRNA factor 2 n=1 Tax=Rhodotorula paludigena TaxID=86838 RepID=A0AAV5GH19_9BASI|nr:hypothetical protein Rhopal_002474-T1 [Rhodotorula paludigena]
MPAHSAAKKRRSSGLARTASSPRASTSKRTLDDDADPAQPSAPADKVKDDRFAAFLDEAGGDDDGAPHEDEVAANGDHGDGHGGDDGELDERALLARTTLPAHLLPRNALAKNAKTPGLVYLSRIPPGMGPGKVKHLLGQFGDVGRIYLARADAGKEISAHKKHKQRERHQSHNFKEGWVEFLDKRVARSVAEMLNAQTIGGKKSDRWHDDVWTMKYLPRFRWDQLSEQVALERATQTSLLRFHLSHSKQEQESYLSAVERARVGRKIEDKAAARGKKRPAAAAAEEGEGGKDEAKRRFRQRERVDTSEKLKRQGDGGKELDSVLGRLF